MSVGLSQGSYADIGGTQVRVGINTNINTTALIQNQLIPQEKVITKIEGSISKNNDISQAYVQLATLAQNLQSAADPLRGKEEIGNGNIDVFQSNTISALCTNGNPSSNYVTFVTENGVELSNFTLTIQQLAMPLIQQSWYFTSNSTSVVSATATAGQFTAGTFSINGVNITLNAGNTLLDVAAAINAQTSDTNVSALVYPTAPGQYRLILQSTLPGVANAYTISDPSNVLNGLFTANATYDPTPTVQAAQDAQFTLNNIPISSTLNVVSGILPNLTFTLLSATGSGNTINVSVQPNITQIIDGIQAFIDAYNALIDFSNQQRARSQDYPYSPLPSAVLANDPLLRDLMTGITPLMVQTVSSLPNYGSLGNIGISYPGLLTTYITGQKISNDNHLAIDQSVLSSVLTTNLSSVRKLFGCTMDSSSSNLMLGIQRGNNLTVSNLTFNINVSNTTNPVTVTYTPSGGSATTINTTFIPKVPSDYTQGGTIKGLSGTILEDFSFIYTGTGTETITATITQGIADKVFNFIQEFDDGGVTFQTAQTQLMLSTNSYNTQLKTKEQQLNKKREQLLNKYARLEEKSQKAQQLQMILQAERDFATRRF